MPIIIILKIKFIAQFLLENRETNGKINADENIWNYRLMSLNIRNYQLMCLNTLFFGRAGLDFSTIHFSIKKFKAFYWSLWLDFITIHFFNKEFYS